MTLQAIERSHAVLKQARVDERRNVALAEDLLLKDIRGFLRAKPISLRAAAKGMDISVAYLSDIVNGRRHVTDSVVTKIGMLK